jgi:hypothetical protein
MEKKSKIGSFRLRKARSKIPFTFLLEIQVSKAILDSTSKSWVDLIIKYLAWIKEISAVEGLGETISHTYCSAMPNTVTSRLFDAETQTLDISTF